MLLHQSCNLLHPDVYEWLSRELTSSSAALFSLPCGNDQLQVQSEVKRWFLELLCLLPAVKPVLLVFVSYNNLGLPDQRLRSWGIFLVFIVQLE